MKTYLLTTAAVLAFCSAAQAQDIGLSDANATLLDTIIITTPLRRESALERSTSSVSVMTQEDIERSAAIDLPSFLRTHAGVSFSGYGGMGAPAGISLRGMKVPQTLVLVNGINLRSATAGTTALAGIPLDSIERVEIAKGSHSAQYGSDAMGGVINIITKGGGACANGKQVCTTLSGGVSYPWGGHAGFNTRGQTQDGTEFAFGGRLLGTQGYDFTTALSEPDKDGFRQGSFNVSLSKEFDWGQLYANALYSRSRTQYDADAPWADVNAASLFAGKIGARIDHTENWRTTLEVFSAFDFQEDTRKGTDTLNIYDTKRYGFFAASQVDFDTGGIEHILNVGVEAYREEISSTDVFNANSRDVGAVFAQHSFMIDALTVDAGIRYDSNEQYGSATTWNVGASYEFVPGFVGRASYATGFRAPTFNDLYNVWGSNPNLQPERSKSYEIGFNWRPTASTTIDAAFYQSWLQDAITLDAMFIPQNIARVRTTGFEASISHEFDARWRGRAEFAYNDPKDRATGLGLIRQDRVKATAELGFAVNEQLDLSAGLVYVGARNDLDAVDFVTRIKQPAYVTMDLSATYAFDEQTQMKLSVENLFDKKYSSVAGYRAPGRSIHFSLARSF